MPARKKIKKEQAAAKENTQTLGDMAYQVFMQSWYIDETLYQVLTEEEHRWWHLKWRNFFEKSWIKDCPRDYKELTSKDGYELTYDPNSDDGWTAIARKQKEVHEKNFLEFVNKLAAGEDKFKCDLKEHGKDRSYEPVLPETSSIDLVNELLEKF